MHAPTLALLTSITTTILAQGSGQSKFYGGNLNSGMCSFSTYTLPSNIYGTALSGQNWDGSAKCGACLRVTGPSDSSITAMVVDQCPECPANGLDLFQDAFEQLADASEGIIQVQWEWTDCGIDSPLQVHMKEGVSAHWFSAQIVNANGASLRIRLPLMQRGVRLTGLMLLRTLRLVRTVGVLGKAGLERQPYNFFEQSSGFGTDTVAVRVVGADGESAVAEDVTVTGGNLVAAGGNL